MHCRRAIQRRQHQGAGSRTRLAARVTVETSGQPLTFQISLAALGPHWRVRRNCSNRYPFDISSAWPLAAASCIMKLARDTRTIYRGNSPDPLAARLKLARLSRSAQSAIAGSHGSSSPPSRSARLSAVDQTRKAKLTLIMLERSVDFTAKSTICDRRHGEIKLVRTVRYNKRKTV